MSSHALWALAGAFVSVHQVSAVEVTLLSDSAFVHYIPGDETAEASNLEASFIERHYLVVSVGANEQTSDTINSDRLFLIGINPFPACEQNVNIHVSVVQKYQHGLRMPD